MLGFGDALVGIARHPYLGAKQEGALGFGKGLGRGLGGLYFHSMAGELTLHCEICLSNVTSNLRRTRILLEGN